MRPAELYMKHKVHITLFFKSYEHVLQFLTCENKECMSK